METVEDDTGTRYVRLKQSSDASLVLDPETGETTYLPNDALAVRGGTDPLEAAAESVAEPLRGLVTGVPSTRALGMLVVLDDRDGMAVRELLESTGMCESDLFGTLRALAGAGLIEQGDTGTADTPVWQVTAQGRDALAVATQS